MLIKYIPEFIVLISLYLLFSVFLFNCILLNFFFILLIFLYLTI